MSIASEITRLQNDRDDIFDALTAKGVTVPANTSFDDVATLIASISGNSNLLYHETFIPTVVYNASNKLQLQLVANTNCMIIVFPTSMPSAPSSGYTALQWGKLFIDYLGDGTWSQNIIHDVLRANGTIGSDISLCDFDKTTGILRIGGSYGVYPVGLEYAVFQFGFSVN